MYLTVGGQKLSKPKQSSLPKLPIPLDENNYFIDTKTSFLCGPTREKRGNRPYCDVEVGRNPLLCGSKVNEKKTGTAD